MAFAISLRVNLKAMASYSTSLGILRRTPLLRHRLCRRLPGVQNSAHGRFVNVVVAFILRRPFMTSRRPSIMPFSLLAFFSLFNFVAVIHELLLQTLRLDLKILFPWLGFLCSKPNPSCLSRPSSFKLFLFKIELFFVLREFFFQVVSSRPRPPWIHSTPSEDLYELSLRRRPLSRKKTPKQNQRREKEQSFSYSLLLFCFMTLYQKKCRW